MSELNIDNLYITSACITGPIVDGICIGPYVNKEFNNNILKEYESDNMRFDDAFNLEERKEDYSEEELDSIYNNRDILEEEDKYYDRLSRESCNSLWKAYEEEYGKIEEERRIDEEEEEERIIKFDRVIGLANRIKRYYFKY